MTKKTNIIISQSPALIMAFFVGAISLSQEIIWIRILSFSSAGAPTTFAHTLGSFLIGIAIGAMIGRRVCNLQRDFLSWSSWMLVFCSVFFYVALPLAAKINLWGFYVPILVLVCLTAAMSGGIFPVVCQIAGASGSAGKSVSLVYLVNIIGATFGSLITGFYLLDKFPISKASTVIFATGIIGSLIILLMKSLNSRRDFIVRFVPIITIVIVSFLFGDKMFYGFLENLQYEKKYPRTQLFKQVVENRSGIITIDEAKKVGDADIVYGGGIYDGRYAIDPGSPNGIYRCYMVAALHREPSHVLEIGFSSGSWAAALIKHEAVKKLKVIEINKGYLEVIKNYEEHKKLIGHQKVDIEINDGRRWLRVQPDDKKFDFMLMNTTFHWRSYATNLLSVEFLELCKEHLKSGGVVFYNTTGSNDVVRTAAEVFKYVTMVGNFVAASDSPFDISSEERRANLLRFKDADGSPIFNRNDQFKEELNRLVEMELPKLGDQLRNSSEHMVITDDNMICEYPRKRSYWIEPKNSWGTMLRNLRKDP